MNKCFLSVAAIAVSVMASNALAQAPFLFNPGFELTFDPPYQTYVQAWRLAQTDVTIRREIGDGLVPPAQVHSGIASVMLPGGDPDLTTNPPINVYQSVQSEEIVPNQAYRNWPPYIYNDVNGAPIYISCWFMIPANDPMVGTKFGLHVDFWRQVNGSIYREREWLDVDPDTTIAPICGTTIVTDPITGVKGIHTNGQWLRFSVSVDQPTDFNDPATGMPYPLAPVDGTTAYARIIALRFGTVHATGTVWVDDVTFSQTPPCAADFNGDGHVTVADIFAFLSAWFAHDCRADFNHVNGITVADIFAYLTAWFAGCP